MLERKMSRLGLHMMEFSELDSLLGLTVWPCPPLSKAKFCRWRRTLNKPIGTTLSLTQLRRYPMTILCTIPRCDVCVITFWTLSCVPLTCSRTLPIVVSTFLSLLPPPDGITCVINVVSRTTFQSIPSLSTMRLGARPYQKRTTRNRLPVGNM